MSFWDQMIAEFESLGQQAAEWLPRIIVALIILIIGRWILLWIRKLTVKFLELGFMQGVFDRAGITGALATSDQTAAGITASVLYAYLIVVLWLIVVRILQIGTLVTLLERFLVWIPTVLLAAVVVVIAAAVGSWVAGLIKPFADSKGVGWLAVLAQIAVIIFGVLFALDLLEITFAEDITKILTAAVGVAFAIAFGVGGIDAGKKWWAKYLSPKDTSHEGH
ncbi:MAG: hypothetical protein BMS9Abin12_1351 [Acidimicrobiia bacterium]|nr:MAG: hypothetical protein BMS9Abin12_1351 [Acidimicrobiia bacterium]